MDIFVTDVNVIVNKCHRPTILWVDMNISTLQIKNNMTQVTLKIDELILHLQSAASFASLFLAALAFSYSNFSTLDIWDESLI